MTTPFEKLFRPVLFGLDAERAHRLSIIGFKTGLVPSPKIHEDPRLNVSIAGIDFANPVGMSAGYDKNAEVADVLMRFGFGSVEVGTVTPRQQAGNAKPRVFRLVQDRAVINRLGFNNQGHDRVVQRLTGAEHVGILGVNIGANKDSANFVDDYVSGVKRFFDVADYFTINISSPNTPGLRSLQGREALHELLENVLAERDRRVAASGEQRPVFLKIAPDLEQSELEDIAAEIKTSALDGLVISNTTLERDGLTHLNRSENGGLSGVPLFERSTIVLARMRRLLGPDYPIIGVGGIDSADRAWTKIRAGANIIQFYTGLVFRGPSLANDINIGLSHKLDQAEFGSITDAVGLDCNTWANKPLHRH